MLDHRVGFGKVLVVGALALAKVGDGVQPEAVDACVQPALHDLYDGADDAGIVEIQVGLMRKEPVPVVGIGFGIPGPV